MGIATGSRLEQLERLRARLAQEITLERIRIALGDPTPHSQGTAPQAPPTPLPPSSESLVTLPMRAVPLKVVRLWARKNGHAVGERGKVHADVCDAFVEAHR